MREDANLCKLLVSSHLSIDLLAVSLHLFSDLGCCEVCFVHSLHVGADESHEGVVGVLHDERLEHERHIVEHVLNLFGVDVLSGRTEEHGLAAPFDEQVSTFVQYAEVAGTKPSVLREDVARSFFVLEIACHDVLSTHFNLAYSGAVG